MKKCTARAAARALGLRTYRNNTPCREGHVGPRLTSNGSCEKCANISDAKAKATKRALNAARVGEREQTRLASLVLCTLEEAYAASRMRYFTGEPCSAGHVDERYVRGGHCVTCHRLAARAERDRLRQAGLPTRAPKRPAAGLRPDDPDASMRRAAALAGQKRYISVRPCPRGHVGTRYVLSGNCAVCPLRPRSRRARPLGLAPEAIEVVNARWRDTPLIGRLAARAQGAVRYFNGSICPEGHRAPRYIHNNECVACSAARSRHRYHGDSQYRRAFIAYNTAYNRRPDVSERRRVKASEYNRRPEVRSRLLCRLRDDPVQALRWNMRTALANAMRKRGGRKDRHLEAALGCSVVEFMRHLELQFLPRMGWHNRARWHVDHIVPLSSACTLEEVVALFCFTNLRPLWAADNRAKGSQRLFLL